MVAKRCMRFGDFIPLTYNTRQTGINSRRKQDAYLTSFFFGEVKVGAHESIP